MTTTSSNQRKKNVAKKTTGPPPQGPVRKNQAKLTAKKATGAMAPRLALGTSVLSVSAAGTIKIKLRAVRLQNAKSTQLEIYDKIEFDIKTKQCEKGVCKIKIVEEDIGTEGNEVNDAVHLAVLC